MRLLLVNKNPVVSRMMQMSVPKAGFEIEECDNVYALPSGTYEVVVIDDEMYDENFLHDIKQHVSYKQLGLITATRAYDSNEFDFILSKPFLPTDLIEILRKVRTTLEKESPQTLNTSTIKEPFDTFLQSKSQENKSPLSELDSLVEIEDLIEESPVVEEIEEKGDVLDKNEIATVSKLLNETEGKSETSLSDILDLPREEKEPFTPKHIRPVSLMEDEKKEDIVRKPEPIDLLDEELDLAEPSQTSHEPLTLLDEEPIPEISQQEKEIREAVHNVIQENSLDSEPEGDIKEVVDEAISDREHTSIQTPVEKEDESPVRSTPIQDEPPVQKTTVQEELKGMIQRMDVQTLRDVLNGMRIDITIQISYPEK